MSADSLVPEPRRTLQLHDPEAQAAFRNWSARDKLEWLEAINGFYWDAVRQEKPGRAA